VIEALKWLGVFALMFTLDVVWARYTLVVINNAAVKASFYATGIMILNGLTTIGYTSDPWLLIPAATGAWLGTFFAVKWKR
jgi:hypothetical protein